MFITKSYITLPTALVAHEDNEITPDPNVGNQWESMRGKNTGQKIKGCNKYLITQH